MNGKQVSVEELLRSMDEFEERYFKSIDDIQTDIEEKYIYLKNSGSLRSEALEPIFLKISNRMKTIKEEFKTAKETIKSSIIESANTIEKQQINIKRELEQ